MSVTVTAVNPTDESYRETHEDVVHDDGRSLSATPEGQLYVFDHAPKEVAESREVSTLGHTVAVYAPGRWVKAVRA